MTARHYSIQQCASCSCQPRTALLPIAEVGTDAERIGTGTRKPQSPQQVVKEMGIEAQGLVETVDGYVAQFLDGIWLRAPYLHNGSVPICVTCSTHPHNAPRSSIRLRCVRPSKVVVTSGDERNGRYSYETKSAARQWRSCLRHELQAIREGYRCWSI